MATKKTRGRQSAAMKFLDELIGEPLTFGTLLKTIRECDELTQAKMARVLGTTKAHICDIEKGRKSVSPARAAKFAKRLGYSEKQFVRLALQDQVEDAGLKLRVTVDAA